MLWKKIWNCIANPRRVYLVLTNSGITNLLSDKTHLKLLYRARLGKKLNLTSPQTFNEKLQWLKLYDRNPIYTTMVDKYAVKRYVADIIGEEHIIPTIGVWDRFEDVDFDNLPNKFVLKCTHDSGGLVICRNKTELNKAAAKKKLCKYLKRNFFWGGREWPYKDVPPRIIAEKYMDDGSGMGLTDYKFYCFNGVPKYLYISNGLENHATASISFLTLDWELAPFGRSDYKPFIKLPEKPSLLNQMTETAAKLSQGYKFLRVDLYQINNKIFFSELTFSPCTGMMPFDPIEWDAELGKLIDISEETTRE